LLCRVPDLAEFDYCRLDLIRKHGEMFGEAIKHLALGFIRCKISDQGALGGVPSQFL
jgi:hypothetical protein